MTMKMLMTMTITTADKLVVLHIIAVVAIVMC